MEGDVHADLVRVSPMPAFLRLLRVLMALAEQGRLLCIPLSVGRHPQFEGLRPRQGVCRTRTRCQGQRTCCPMGFKLIIRLMYSIFKTFHHPGYLPYLP
jgi:hypothetical protein